MFSVVLSNILKLGPGMKRHASLDLANFPFWSISANCTSIALNRATIVFHFSPSRPQDLQFTIISKPKTCKFMKPLSISNFAFKMGCMKSSDNGREFQVLGTDRIRDTMKTASGRDSMTWSFHIPIHYNIIWWPSISLGKWCNDHILNHSLFHMYSVSLNCV